MKALIIATFGTVHRDAVERDIEPLIEGLKKKADNFDVRLTLTSRRVIDRIEEREGVRMFNEREIIDELIREGYAPEDIYIQPLHIIAGIEFEKLSAYRSKGIHVGEPLLYSEDDLDRFIEKTREFSSKPTLWVGHGSPHRAHGIYRALEEKMEAKGVSMAISTLEGGEDREEIFDRMKAKGWREIVVRPLLLVAGEHVKHDIMGEEDSYRTALIDRGFEIEIETAGLGSFSSIRSMYEDKCDRLIRGEFHA